MPCISQLLWHGSDGYRFKGEHVMYSQDELVAMMPDNEDEEDEEREVG